MAFCDWVQLGSLLTRALQGTVRMCVCVCVCVYACMLSSSSRDQLFVTPWTVVHQAPLSMGSPRQEYSKWVTMSSSRRSSQPRDQTHVS